MKRLSLLFWLGLRFGVAQPVITTSVGTDWLFPGDGKPALGAPFGDVRGVTQDAQGNAVFCSARDNVVMRLNPDGTLSVIAGNGLPGFSGDGGPAVNASLNFPRGVVYDAQGNLYIADASNNRIRQVTPDGTITTYAGTGLGGFSGDRGPASLARLRFPGGLAVDAAGNLYIADRDNYRIRRIDPSGTITTFAGTGVPSTVSGSSVTTPACSDGPALSTRIGAVEGLAIDSNQNLYLADYDSQCVRRIGADGAMKRIAGQASGLSGISSDGTLAINSALRSPSGVAVDTSGNVFIVESNNYVVRLIDARTSRLSTVAGKARGTLATDEKPFFPWAISLDSNGRGAYIISSANRLVHRITATTSGFSPTTTVAGGGVHQPVPPGTPVSQGFLKTPAGLAFDRSQKLYIADYDNSRVLVATPDGKLSTFAGNGNRTAGEYNKQATDVGITDPESVAVDAAGNVYIAHPIVHVVNKVGPDGSSPGSPEQVPPDSAPKTFPRPRPRSANPVRSLSTARAISTSGRAAARPSASSTSTSSASARSLPMVSSPRFPVLEPPDLPATVCLTSAPATTFPAAWPSTPRATFMSPITSITASARSTSPRG